MTSLPSPGKHTARVADNLRAFRTRRRLSVRELADRLKKLERPLYASAITKIELGQRRIDIDDLFALAEALDIPVAKLLEERHDPTCMTCEDTPPSNFTCNDCGTVGGAS